jgi:hypothetical protein
MPITVSRATTARSAMSASSNPPPSANPETSATVTFGYPQENSTLAH